MKDGRKGKGSDRGGSKKKKNKRTNKGVKVGNKNERKDFEKNPDVITPKKKASVLRKKVDPETAKYFLEIANLFESNAIDLEERPSVCANALDEARGKEVELATDVVISHTLQTLIEGCDLEQLCDFLHGCIHNFCFISMDKCGSHVVETAFKSLAQHLQDIEALPIVEDTLTKICKVVAVDSVDMMCSCYGSHVLRSILCFCKGIPFHSLEDFHSTKASKVLADRLNIKLHHHSGDKLLEQQKDFPDLLKCFTLEMLRHAGDGIKSIRIDKYGSFVLQVILKSLVGHDRELAHAISFILGHFEENISGELSELLNPQELLPLIEDTAASHLVEVILQVAPDNLYEEMLEKIFRGSLYQISSHNCGNFAIQALISNARTKAQVDLIWEEIGPKMKELLGSGKGGVIASLLAACHRLQTRRQECCKVLAHAVKHEDEHCDSIVPRLLFLNSFLCCVDKTTWQWPLNSNIHVLGCLMLQTIFKFPSKYMQLYTKSLLSLEADKVFKIAGDAGGSRLLESFICSDASAKVKMQLISKLQDHFGELSLHPSGSFMIEKCFGASNIYFREMIVKKLSEVKDQLSKTKHGPHIIKNLGIDRYIRGPEQWKSSQVAKEAIYREFQATFGSCNKGGDALASTQFNSNHGEKRVEVYERSRGSDEKLVAGKNSNACEPGFIFKHGNKKFVSSPGAGDCFIRCKKRKPSSGLADLASKRTLSSSDVQRLLTSDTSLQKRQKKNI